MMGMLRDSFRRRLGDDGLMAIGGGENLRQVLGDLGASPCRYLALWLLENKSSSDLWRGEEEGEKVVGVDLPPGSQWLIFEGQGGFLQRVVIRAWGQMSIPTRLGV